MMCSRPQTGHAKVGIMDGEDDLGAPEAIGLVVLPKGLGHACRAPVMAVQDIWLAACLQQELQCSLQISHLLQKTFQQTLTGKLILV